MKQYLILNSSFVSTSAGLNIERYICGMQTAHIFYIKWRRVTVVEQICLSLFFTASTNVLIFCLFQYNNIILFLLAIYECE